MEKFYCNVCDKLVELNNGKCPMCNTNWESIVSNVNKIEPLYEQTNDMSDDINLKEKVVNTFNKNELNDDIKDTWTFFLNMAKVGKYICFVMAIIIVVISLKYIEENSIVTLLLLVPSCILVFYGFLFEKNLKWKAYMLQTNYTLTTKRK